MIFKVIQPYILLACVIILLMITVHTTISDKTERAAHFEEMETFRARLEKSLNNLEELQKFKNKGERFTADDGRKHKARMDTIEARLDKVVEEIQLRDREK